MLPESVIPALREHLERAKLTHEQDLREGHGEVYLPGALDRKYRGAARQWGWQYVFPARDLSTDPRGGITRRHHVDETTVHRAIKIAVARTSIAKRVSSHTFRHSSQLPCSSVARTSALSRNCWAITMSPPR
jgi:integrase